MSKNKNNIAPMSVYDGLNLQMNNLSRHHLELTDKTLMVIDRNSLSYQYQDLEGKLLTLCDASFSNEKQLEAFKSIVRNNIWDNFYSIYCALVSPDMFKK